MMKIDQGDVPNLSGCFNCIEGVSVVPSLVSRGARRQVFVMSLLLAIFGSKRSSETICGLGLRARQIHKLVRSQLSMFIPIWANYSLLYLQALECSPKSSLFTKAFGSEAKP